ncbi:hypothetical protein T484DRAFT_2292722, partial [Baffinella frigidus]
DKHVLLKTKRQPPHAPQAPSPVLTKSPSASKPAHDESLATSNDPFRVARRAPRAPPRPARPPRQLARDQAHQLVSPRGPRPERRLLERFFFRADLRSYHRVARRVPRAPPRRAHPPRQLARDQAHQLVPPRGPRPKRRLLERFLLRADLHSSHRVARRVPRAPPRPARPPRLLARGKAHQLVPPRGPRLRSPSRRRLRMRLAHPRRTTTRAIPPPARHLLLQARAPRRTCASRQPFLVVQTFSITSADAPCVVSSGPRAREPA